MSFQDIELKPEYRSRLDNVIRDFYNPVLKQAITYRRAVGFFSSSALLSLTAGICGLIDNGGQIQVIASPRLSPEDIEAINDGIRRRDEVIKEALLRELRRHHRLAGGHGRRVRRCLQVFPEVRGYLAHRCCQWRHRP